MTDKEFSVLKKKLELIFHYLGRTIGLLILVSGYWMTRTGMIDSFSAMLWVFVAAAIGLYGNRVNFDFLKAILRVKQPNPPKDETDANN
jgi:hypothetical protein